VRAAPPHGPRTGASWAISGSFFATAAEHAVVKTCGGGRRRRFRLLGLWAVASILAASTVCGGVAVAETTLRVAVSALPPAQGNPHTGTNVPTSYTWSAIFDGLTYVNSRGETEPALALSWEAASPTVWRFRLRPGVTFSNGEAFDAQAVVDSILYVIGEGRALGVSVSREVEDVTAARVVDAQTVEVETGRPNPFLPQALSTLRIVAPNQWKRLGPEGFARAPVGTGPFMVEKWDPARVTLKAFRGSWRAPKVDRLVILQLGDLPARVQGIQAGQVDVAVGVGPDDEAAITAAGGRTELRPGHNVFGIALISVKPGSPFKDRRVRQALNYAIDAQGAIDALLGGATVRPSQPAPRMAFGYNPDLKPYPYDPAKAKQLLAEAGYPNGFRFTMQMVVGGIGGDAAILQQAALDLARVGVRMDIRPMPSQQLIRGIQQGDWEGEAFAMDFGTAPTFDALRPMRLHSCSWRRAWFCDESVMPLIEKARDTFDIEERRRLTRELMTALRETAPGVFLFEVVFHWGLSSRVDGFDADFGNIRYERITLR
jgi:peptide/nickel transport system substrate-binding protein